MLVGFDGLKIFQHLQIELDEVVLVGQLNTFDAGGKTGNRFVLAERVKSPGAGLFIAGFRIAVGFWQAEAELRYRLYAELRFEKAGTSQAFVVATRRLPFDHSFEQPSPA